MAKGDLMSQSTLDPILASLSYEVIEMLRAFRESPTFKEIGQQFNHDERTVGGLFRKVDAAFHETTGFRLLERDAGSRGYHLTNVGEEFISRLPPAIAAIKAAVAGATAATHKIRVMCTSNCMPHLKKLNDYLPSDRSFEIVPFPRRTSEINTSDILGGNGTQISLLSTLVPDTQGPRTGTTLVDNTFEIIPLTIDPVRLLCAEDLNLRGPVTVRQVVEEGVTFLTPEGGPAWEFLNRNFPNWRTFRPFQHVNTHDLDFGLKCLAARMPPRSAMVVHGLNDEKLKPYELGTPQFLDFASDGKERLLAVTGVFRLRKTSDDESGTDPYDVIWDTAKSLWLTKENS
jgi:hypothetical protein